jgi:hypothetical protein
MLADTLAAQKVGSEDVDGVGLMSSAGAGTVAHQLVSRVIADFEGLIEP